MKTRLSISSFCGLYQTPCHRFVLIFARRLRLKPALSRFAPCAPGREKAPGMTQVSRQVRRDVIRAGNRRSDSVNCLTYGGLHHEEKSRYKFRAHLGK